MYCYSISLNLERIVVPDPVITDSSIGTALPPNDSPELPFRTGVFGVEAVFRRTLLGLQYGGLIMMPHSAVMRRFVSLPVSPVCEFGM